MFDVTGIIATYGYIGIFFITLLESGIFFALPGDSLLFTAGISASQGYLNLPLVMVLTAVGSFLGSIAGYGIGMFIDELHRFSLFRALLSREHIARVHEFFDRYGRVAIVLSRFVPIVRTFTPIAAGIGKMHRRPFVLYNALGALMWGVIVPLLGYVFGRLVPHISDYLSLVIAVIIILSFVPGIAHAIRRSSRGSGHAS